jgi:hypothetical protein
MQPEPSKKVERFLEAECRDLGTFMQNPKTGMHQGEIEVGDGEEHGHDRVKVTGLTDVVKETRWWTLELDDSIR